MRECGGGGEGVAAWCGGCGCVWLKRSDVHGEMTTLCVCQGLMMKHNYKIYSTTLK